MKAMYNRMGDERKALVKAVGEIVGVKPKYLGAPGFAFRIGSFEIDKEGTLSAPRGTEIDAFERLLTQLHIKGFLYEAREDDVGVDSGPEVSDDGVSAETAAQPTEQNAPELVPELVPTPEPDRFTIELPLGGLTDAQLLNLEKLVASKASLIKKALGASELTIIRIEDKLAFPWFSAVPDSRCISAYARFIGALYVTAKRQKRVLGTERAVDSEKFGFRIFLLRLGMSGAEYADVRKVLLQNLGGNAAFPNDAKAREHAERWKEKRQQRRLAASTVETEATAGELELSNHLEEDIDDKV